ncbi:MAG: hypothetical protein Q3993_00715 [Filifactor alocis]|nr:hypothetical protein [Filifactor alocis]
MDRVLESNTSQGLGQVGSSLFCVKEGVGRWWKRIVLVGEKTMRGSRF